MTGADILNKMQKDRYKSCGGGGTELCVRNAPVFRVNLKPKKYNKNKTKPLCGRLKTLY